MSDLRDVAALLASLKTAFDLSKAFLDVRGAVKEQGKVFELQRVILAAQESALNAQQAEAALLSQIDGLEKRIAELEAWDAEKERYELASIGTGVVAYTLKPDAKGTGPEHYLCAPCFDSRHKSILQNEVRMPGMARVAVCNRCGADHYTSGPRHADHGRPRRSRS